MHVIDFIRSRRYLTVLTGFVLLAVGITLLVFFLQVLPELFTEVTTDDGIPELARFESAVPVREPAPPEGSAEADGGETRDLLEGATPASGTVGGFRPIKGVVLGDDTLVLDAGAGSVLRLAADGALSEVTLERPRSAGARVPRFTDLEVSDTGTLLITDLANGQVWNYSLEGRYLAPLLDAGQRRGADLTRPTSITRDPDGRLLVTDVGDHQVKVFNKAGELLLTFGGFGFAPGRMNYPTDVAIDPQGDIFVADSENRRIQVFNPRGEYQREFRETGDLRGPGVASDAGFRRAGAAPRGRPLRGARVGVRRRGWEVPWRIRGRRRCWTAVQPARSHRHRRQQGGCRRPRQRSTGGLPLLDADRPVDRPRQGCGPGAGGVAHGRKDGVWTAAHGRALCSRMV